MLEVVLLSEGARLDVCALVTDGDSEVMEFLLRRHRDDRPLLESVQQMLKHVADHGYFAPQSWFRKLRGWPDQWEIRKGRHRLLGFVTGRRLILCLYRLKQGQRTDAGDLERVDRLRREWADDDGEA
jgi:hypothetical protein